MTEFESTRERSLKITYWILTYSVMIAILMALVTDAMNHPHNGGVPRLMGLVLVGVLALVWVWLSSLGKEALREMA